MSNVDLLTNFVKRRKALMEQVQELNQVFYNITDKNTCESVVIPHWVMRNTAIRAKIAEVVKDETAKLHGELAEMHNLADQMTALIKED